MGTKTPTETAGDEDPGVLVEPGGVVEPPGLLAVGPDVGAGVQSSGVPELGEGVVGGVVVVGGVGDGEAPGVAETEMESFWPNWQCWPIVQM